MRKKIFISLGALVLLLVIYFAGVGYYAQRFTSRTTFSGVNIGQLTVEQAQKKVESNLSSQVIKVVEDGQQVGQIEVKSLKPTYQVQNELNALYKAQDPRWWPVNFFKPFVIQQPLENQIQFDNEAVARAIDQLNIDNDKRTPMQEVSLVYTPEAGYQVQEGQAGNQIGVKSLSYAVKDTLAKASNTLDLKNAYEQPRVASEDEDIQSLIQLINNISNTKVTLDIAGDQVTIPKDLIESWIYFDEDNHLVIDEHLVRVYIDELNDEYATFSKTRTFESTLQGTVEVLPGYLGWAIDKDNEVNRIISDLLSHTDTEREPAVLGTVMASHQNKKDDVGNTYIEIDLTHQTMFLYIDGELYLETPIVSGTAGVTPTEPGAHAVNSMLANTNLVGFNPVLNVDYSVPVSYWIGFDDNAQGIHDASWQGYFGGGAYYTSGSLGCINTPLDSVATLFSYAEMGMPVIVF